MDRDEKLAQVIDDWSARQRGGETIDLAVESELHPNLAADLKSLWAAHQLAEALARPPAAQRSARTEASAFPAPQSFADFEIERELGRGGMGVVYLAWQKSLGRRVALKMVLHGPFASASDRERFRAEAGAAGKLVHPNIVPVFEVGEHEGRPYFVMPYVAGETLAQRVARGPLPPREAAELVAKIARGIEAAHQQGVVHRDLKPSNVLLEEIAPDATPSGAATFQTDRVIPKVTDFGLAKLLDDGAAGLTSTGMVIGTPSYMAPEQAGATKKIGPATDVYSLGAILYELLTGRPPFQAPTHFDTISLVLEQEPVPPRLLNPSTPRELEAIALKCLEKSANRRYARAGDLANDLDAYLHGEAISVTPGGMAYFFDRAFRETHHAAVLENWGLLWMWHSLQLLILCTITQVMEWSGVGSHAAYLALWSVGLTTWGAIFWSLRRRGGPVRFVERQVAHAWAAGVAASIGIFIIEVVMGEPALKFSPVLAVVAGMIFLVKAGILAGIFYIAAAALFATALAMAAFPQCGVLLFGIASAACFFFPGLKYYRQRLRARPAMPPNQPDLTDSGRTHSIPA